MQGSRPPEYQEPQATPYLQDGECFGGMKCCVYTCGEINCQEPGML